MSIWSQPPKSNAIRISKKLKIEKTKKSFFRSPHVKTKNIVPIIFYWSNNIIN